VRWNRHTILDEIRELHRSGDELNYTSAEENHLHLVRAAAWHYGTWKQAVELAGLDYDSVSKYKRWTRERVIQAIRDHHKAGHDLSWRSISIALDPPLAAAALRPNVGFETWRDAVTAAGLNHDEIARYRHWTPERVTAEIAELAKKGSPLSSKLVQMSNQSLYCAAKRRFKDWDSALAAAGVDPDSVRLRRAPSSTHPRRRRNSAGQLTMEHLNGNSDHRPSSRLGRRRAEKGLKDASGAGQLKEKDSSTPKQKVSAR
jgi:hypothetical protein